MRMELLGAGDHLAVDRMRLALLDGNDDGLVIDGAHDDALTDLTQIALFSQGFHPGKEATDLFADRFGKLTHSKSTLRLPYDQPMPWDLLREMVEFCVQENLKDA